MDPGRFLNCATVLSRSSESNTGEMSLFRYRPYDNANRLLTKSLRAAGEFRDL
jgi:hypothetical protein